MTDSMKFGPEWLRNLSSDGSTAGGTSSSTIRYQLADYRYGREEMLALFDKNFKSPPGLSAFHPLYSEPALPPLALIPPGEEERGWQTRPVPPGGIARGRGASLERGVRPSRGRPPYQTFGRGYETSGTNWNNNSAMESNEWSPRKIDYTSRASSVDNWRRNRMGGGDDDEGWRSNCGTTNISRSPMEKWGRSTSWRDGGDGGEESRGPDRSTRVNWQPDGNPGRQGAIYRRTWDGGEDHLPEWAMENPSESGGTFDSTGAFHGSDDEQKDLKTASRREPHLQHSISQPSIPVKSQSSSQSITSQPNQPLSKSPDNTKPSSKLVKEPSTSIDEEKPPEITKPQIVDKSVKSIEISRESKGIEQSNSTSIIMKEQQNDRNLLLNSNVNGTQDVSSDLNNKVEEEFDRMQEDIVKKLMVDEDTPRKPTMVDTFGMIPTVTPNLPPPNLTSVAQDKWYYQDPQGDLQGPFLSSEMAEWFRAGYFSGSLLVKRPCDESFYRLGDLVSVYGGNPFMSNIRIPPLKTEIPNPPPDPEMIQYQMFQRQLALNRQQQNASMRVLNHPDSWNNMCNPPQRDMLSQQVLQHPQMAPDLQFLQQSAPPQTNTNPLMQMINQMQQANKLSTLPEKPPTLQPQLDPIQVLVQQMGGLSSMQNPSNIPGLPTSVPSTVPLSTAGLGSANLLNNFQNLSGTGLTGALGNNPGGVPLGLSSVGGQLQNPVGLLVNASLSNSSLSSVGAGIQSVGVLPTVADTTTLSNAGGLPSASGLPSCLTSTLPPRPNPLGAVDPIASNENEAIKNLLRQLASKQQNPQLDSLWQQNQFNNAHGAPTGVVSSTANVTPKIPQWQQPNSTNEVPLTSAWDFQSTSVTPQPVISTTQSNLENHQQQQAPIPPKPTISNVTEQSNKAQEKDKQKQLKELKEAQEKELKKKKEMEEKQAKKEAEEKRKEEQRKLEAERKLAEEKKKKEEERIRKELEKAKKEAEEKRQKELEEKRRLKEQRRAEEEARRKSEEQRKVDEVERARREAKEREEKQKVFEMERQEINNSKAPKIAPWSQSNMSTSLSLTEIQKAEREKRAEQTALLQQQLRAQQVLQEQQAVMEKNALPFNWAKKPPEPRKVKSLAEIQQEEQERLAKQAAEQRIAQNKEREAAAINPNTNIPWSGQNLSWASTAAQWSNSSTTTGFWDDSPLQHKSPSKSVPVSKSSSTSAVNAVKQQQQQQQQQVKSGKNKTKKEEQQVLKLFANGPATDEFTAWCTMALGKLTNTVDIPTFISFLRDIESALEIREYCKEYLGDGPTTQQFAAQFLEKRRLIKPKNVTQKDDLSAPAPALTPSNQVHMNEFQEVKAKGKKMKKSKMTKVDARILGFSVTSAPDRINVGDRDYVEN